MKAVIPYVLALAAVAQIDTADSSPDTEAAVMLAYTAMLKEAPAPTPEPRKDPAPPATPVRKQATPFYIPGLEIPGKPTTPSTPKATPKAAPAARPITKPNVNTSCNGGNCGPPARKGWRRGRW